LTPFDLLGGVQGDERPSGDLLRIAAKGGKKIFWKHTRMATSIVGNQEQATVGGRALESGKENLNLIARS